MRRTHIHFAAGLAGEQGVISGMRKSCQVLSTAATHDGPPFSRNLSMHARIDGPSEMNASLALIHFSTALFVLQNPPSIVMKT